MSNPNRYQCPECQSRELFTTMVEPKGLFGPNLLPALTGFTHNEQLQAVLCRHCGLLRLFASEQACGRLENSNYWSPISP
jgi:hypothetical protein